jgi:signal transduction histidine kinase
MLFKNLPITKKLMRIIFLINGIVLLGTCVTFFIYEYYTFRKTIVEKMSTIAKIISANSTAALAFDSPEDAKETLAALNTEPNIVAACLYDKNGKLFAQYRSGLDTTRFPDQPHADGYRFTGTHLLGFEPVILDNRPLGTLYLQSDMKALHERLRLYAFVVGCILLLSFVLAYVLVQVLKKSISTPILSLAETAKIVYERQDYAVRAVKMGNDELGTLTDAFNRMLDQIHYQDNQLREFNQHLEQKVKERTMQLESVNKELEGFSYSVSHDLRAPLRAIIGFATVLEEDYTSKLDAEARRIMTVIKDNTMKMGKLIDDLLAFSRLGRQDISKTCVDMAALVNEVKAGMAFQTDISNIHWTIDPLPEVNANANMIKQVWVNLISNAIKYSGKRTQPHIKIGSFLKDKQTVFFVKDNGVGFDPQYANKLFKVFHRLHRAEEFEGTGIGLALVEKIVVRQGGHVWAESALDKGACFYFSLPA